MLIDLPGEKPTERGCVRNYVHPCLLSGLQKTVELQPYYVNFQDYNQAKAIHGVFDDDDLDEYLFY